MNFNSQNKYQHVFYPPLSIHDFNVIKELGHGAHGSVYLVQYKKTNSFYALKTYEQKAFQMKKLKELDYKREKAILYDVMQKNNINSINIVKLYRDFEDSHFKYLVLEFVEGTNLDDLRGYDNPYGYVSQKQIINILFQLLQTLQFLHDECHVIHRDIKPDNIFLTRDNKIKLLDFELSVYLKHSNNDLVSKRSRKGFMHFSPPEVLLEGKIDYDYKIDIFALGFTIYSIMNPSNDKKKRNLPQVTKKTDDDFVRIDNELPNKFYQPWLINFVKSLYDNDKNKRPTAREALMKLQMYLNNPTMAMVPIQPNIIKNSNIISIFQRYPSQINNNNFIPMINNYPNNFFGLTINSNQIEQKRIKAEEFLQSDNGKENRIISSMTTLLQILYRIEPIEFMKTKYFSLFSNIQINYSKLYIYYFYCMIIKISEINIGFKNQNNVSEIINDFIRQTIISNNSGISGTRPIILFYMIACIFNEEFKKYFYNIYQNNIFDKEIQNNFYTYNNILPMNNPQVYNQLKANIFEFKNNFRGFFVEKFYFMILNIYNCVKCNSFFEMKTQINSFLQLDVPNPENEISQLIDKYFSQKKGIGVNCSCPKCGPINQKFKRTFCLNFPEFLILEFEDKNIINFDDNIYLLSYNGQKIYYEYFACIYKFKNNNASNFAAIMKIGNNYFNCIEYMIGKWNQTPIRLESPSMAIYKKIKYKK